MIRSARPLVFVALAVVGCGTSDPVDSILQPGQTVVVSDPAGVYLTSKDFVPKLEPGVRLTVGHDPGEYVESQADFEERLKPSTDPAAIPVNVAAERAAGPTRARPGQTLARLRLIKVTVETGAASGRSGEITRQDVRPIP